MIQGYRVVFHDVLDFLTSLLTSSSLVVTGAQVSHEEHGEAVEISSAEQTKYKTSVKHKGNLSWTLGNQGICITKQWNERNTF